MASKVPSFGRIASKEESIFEAYYCYNQFFQADLVYLMKNDKKKSLSSTFNAYFGAKNLGMQEGKFDMKSNVSIDVKMEKVQCTASVNEKEALAFNVFFPFNKRKIAQIRSNGLYVKPELRFKACPLAKNLLKEVTASFIIDSKCAKGILKLSAYNINLGTFKGSNLIGIEDESNIENTGIGFNIYPLAVSGLIGITANLALENSSARWKLKANLHNISLESSRGTEFKGFSGRIRLNPDNFSISNFGIGVWLRGVNARFSIIYRNYFQGNEENDLNIYLSQKIFGNINLAAKARIMGDNAVITVGNEIRYNKYQIMKAKVSTSGIIGLALYSKILLHSTVNISAEFDFLHPLRSIFGVKLNFRAKSTK